MTKKSLLFFYCERYLPLFLFVFLVVLYAAGISSTVTAGDVGDFLTAMYEKTLPHPPGFPLFTMLGIMFSYLPFFSTLAWKIGLLSSVSVAGASIFLFFSLKRLVKSTLIATVASLIFALLYPVWLYAEVAEVFGVTLLFESLLFYLSVRFFQEKSKHGIFLLAFVSGLALSVHQVLVLLFPSICLVILFINKNGLLRIKTIVYLLIFFFLGLLPYSYIPIAGHFDTTHKWADLRSFSDVGRYVLRLSYGWSTSVSLVQKSSSSSFGSYLLYWIREFSPLLVVSLLGVFIALRRAVFTTVFLVGLFFVGPFFVLYSSTAPTTDELLGALERFYLLSAFFLVIFLAFGLLFLFDYSKKRVLKSSFSITTKKYLTILVTLFLCIVPLIFFLANYQRTNLSTTKIGEDFAVDSLSGLPEKSLLLSGADTITLNTYFVQHVLAIRPDIVFLSREPLNNYVMSNRSLSSSRMQLAQKFTSLSGNDLNIVTLLLQKDPGHPIFSTSKLFSDDKRFPQISWIPYGLVYKLHTKLDDSISARNYGKQQSALWTKMHLRNIASAHEENRLPLLLKMIPVTYAKQLIFTADYLRNHYHDPKEAVIFLRMAAGLYPEAVEPYEKLGAYYATQRNCSKAQENFVLASRLDSSFISKYKAILQKYCGQ